MSLLRKSNLEQLRRINKEIKKQGGETDRSLGYEEEIPNTLWIGDPVESDKKSKRKIATIDDIIKIEKNNNSKMKNVKNFDQVSEEYKNGLETKNYKTIANLSHVSNYNTKKEMSIGLIGKFIETDKVKGYISRIEGGYVIVDSIVEPFGLVKIPLKDAIKNYKPEKEKNVSFNIDLQGPKNKSIAIPPKEDKDYYKQADYKSNVAKDQKISNEINKEKHIKRLSDLSIELDDTTIEQRSKDKFNKANNTEDSEMLSKIYKENKIKKLSDLSNEMDDSILQKRKDVFNGKVNYTDDSKMMSKFYRENKIKKLDDLSIDIDDSTIERKDISSNIDGKATETDDSKMMSKIYREKKIRNK